MPDRNKTAPVMDDLKGESTQAKQLMELDYEKQAAQNAAGLEEQTYGVWGPIWRFLRWKESLKGRHRFKKKNYLWFMLFLGWAGGHRYYQGRWKLGLIYTAFCWTGIPLALCITDLMEVLPIQADEEGYIVL
ncbi:MAG: TM2 domain-containing protein [Firmicutes bacterium]|nr:TM2 domain-containing protein [Bacillota bacterium]